MPFRLIESHESNRGYARETIVIGIYGQIDHHTGKTIGYQTRPVEYKGDDPLGLVHNHKTFAQARKCLTDIWEVTFKTAARAPKPKMKMRDYPQNQKGYNAASAAKR